MALLPSSEAAGTGDAHEHALRTLRNLQIDAEQVIAVMSDAILFITPDGEAFTAWLAYRDGMLHHRLEHGFPAFPQQDP